MMGNSVPYLIDYLVRTDYPQDSRNVITKVILRKLTSDTDKVHANALIALLHPSIEEPAIRAIAGTVILTLTCELE